MALASFLKDPQKKFLLTGTPLFLALSVYTSLCQSVTWSTTPSVSVWALYDLLFPRACVTKVKKRIIDTESVKHDHVQTALFHTTTYASMSRFVGFCLCIIAMSTTSCFITDLGALSMVTWGPNPSIVVQISSSRLKSQPRSLKHSPKTQILDLLPLRKPKGSLSLSPLLFL